MGVKQGDIIENMSDRSQGIAVGNRYLVAGLDPDGWPEFVDDEGDTRVRDPAHYRVVQPFDDAPAKPDMVNSPPHYTQGGIETIEAIRAALTPEEFRGYCKGNAIKYVWRERHKGGDEDLGKSVWYLNKLLEAGS